MAEAQTNQAQAAEPPAQAPQEITPESAVETVTQKATEAVTTTAEGVETAAENATETVTQAIEEPPLIDELTDPGFWSTFSTTVTDWVQTNVFTQSTLIELGIIVACALLAWPIAAQVSKRFAALAQKEYRFAVLHRLWATLKEVAFVLTWLSIQLVAIVVTSQMGVRDATLIVTTSLLTAWVVVRVGTAFVANPFWSQTIAIIAWIVAALNILGVLPETMAILDGLSLNLGEVSVTMLTIVQGLFALGVLWWLSSVISQIIESRLKASPNLTPSIQVLSTKLVHIALGAFAIFAALTIVGVDLTALAVFSGAVGVGLGFGLQKIFANLVSGFILLLDKSIKPGDVIAVPEYYGRVDSLGARYVSVTTRDGIEHLIPNEELITTRVENWSHSQNLLRLRKTVGVHYKSDVARARALCLEACDETERVLKDPKPACLLKDFGESSVDLEMRFWIDDPMNGRANVISEVLTRVWEKFHANDIEIPYPQRDLHLRSSDLSR